MRNLFAPADGMVLTSFGTRVFFDHAARRLRHGAAESVPYNLMVRIEGRQCRLLAMTEDGGGLVSCIPPNWDAGPCRLAALTDPFRFIRADPGAGLLAFLHAGAALRAEPNGRVSMLPEETAPEGRFAVVTRHTLRVRDALLAGRWIDPEQGVLVPPAAASGGRLGIGGLDVPMAGVPGPFVAEPAGGMPIRRVHVVAPGGLVRSFVRYRPLICFAVFGDEPYYQCLTLALESLWVHGRYGGEVCIAADRARSAVARYIPEAFRQRWRHVRSDLQARLFSRYDMEDWGLEGFQPLLYLDVDVAANAPIAPMLRKLAVSKGIHVSTENRLEPKLAGKPAAAYAGREIGNWFGAWLSTGDSRFASVPFALFSSGIMGFSNVDMAREAFAIIRAQRRIVDPALIASFTDQALANYAFHCLGCAKSGLLDPHVDFVRGKDATPRRRRGLVHFHSGVGNGDGKLAAMRRYLEELGTPAAASVS